ncbi:phenylalanine--tRNA ligase subunit beta [Lysobacter pythonis]|uniref:Phenylalanine--tRNA ligase beta subunit n=1 Tax=Solilutibacter pythonis TaxID=2483112 RepID=A0A3M2I893_9GAMM|nr:phenylalanine--tRNA ligase subunit beta [Lysobacter pythonis]RMH94514.1 phenylalanine--tRNA ligase subunit beta [Lysobacter pythonis]
MKFSENWLREHVATDIDTAALERRLTMIGLEVESIEALGVALDKVLVAEIVSAAKHPEADRLQVCEVEAGAHGRLQIVCGAPNARAGLKVPLAMVGAKLGEMVIKTAKLRGVESSGMLCSAKELGLDNDASGLLELPGDAPAGTPLADYLGLPDNVIELGLTPNRADCFCIRGIARDLVAATGGELSALEIETVAPVIDSAMVVELNAGTDASRYVGRVIEGVDAGARTPLWMAERLRRSGIRPVSFLVDVTQYVMLELGQPMHAFDRDLLRGPVGVRRARKGETLKLLDGRDVAVDDEFLLITDADKPVALAGVMGGFDSRVSDATRNVFLEAAHFAPEAIIGRSRKLGLHTDAAHRFERGVDPELPRIAIERATKLILDIAGGQPGPVVEAVDAAGLPKPASIGLRRGRIARVLGIDIADADIERILGALGFVFAGDAEGWRVTPPTRRFDIAIEEDLIEEVARIHGYDRIPVRLPGGAARVVAPDAGRVPECDQRRQLAARDWQEAINYAFVDAGLLAKWQVEGGVALANPLSAELGVMRPMLLPGLTAALGRNVARQQSRVRLFEIGRVFAAPAAAGEAPVEIERIAAVACGHAVAEQWGLASRPVDFHDLKGDLQSLAALSGARLAFSRGTEAFGHPGRSADVYRDGRRIGWIGELHPGLWDELGIGLPVVGFELDLAMLARRGARRAEASSKFPSVRRDLSLLVPEAVEWQALADTVRQAAGGLLRDLRLFDRYVGKGVDSGFKSLTMGLILQEESRTLTELEVDEVVASVIEALAREHGANIRG